jgi:MinD-like ATPase involved in chromosome partitioning or flagellar assembly
VDELRLLLAVDHTEIQKFIGQEHNVDISEVAKSEQELYEILNDSKADTLILSKYLKGSENPKLLVEYIITTKPALRIVYLYGKPDTETEAFIKYLISKRVTDYHVGTNVSSLELRRLLFGGKEHVKTGISDLFKRRGKTLWFKELDTAVITIYSNASNGKSHLAWNMATAFEKNGYKTTLINIDRGYSANIYFGIENIYFDLLEYLIAKGEHQKILDNCYRKGELRIVAGRLGNEETVCNEDFLKLLYFARSKSDIVVIDTYTGLLDTTFQAINSSNIDFLVFDSDLMHFHMNKLMLEKLGSIFIENKTFAIINNCNTGSEAYKYIYKQISKLNYKFKDILPLSSCGSMGCDLMHTGNTPYETAKNNSNFRLDIENILGAINTRNTVSAKHKFNRGGS